MKECNFMLSLLLLLSERLACYASLSICLLAFLFMDLAFKLQIQGFTTEPAVPEGSGLLPSTVQVVLGTSTTFVVLTSSDQNLKTATPLTETEFSATAEIYPTNGNGIEDLHPALIYGVPAAFVLVLLVLLIFFITRRRKQKQLKQEELGSENCKSPIFEEDTPSVMEIEMEELDKWMNSLKKNAECEYLTPVKEEKDLNAKTSDCES